MNRPVVSTAVPGMVLILAGALLALLPQFVLPVCTGVTATASGVTVPMKCFWTARAELGGGALLVFAGLLYCLCRNATARLGIAAVAAGVALLAIAFPALLIGVCPAETMACRMGTLPGLVLAGILGFFAALAACRGSIRAMRKEKPS